MSENQYQESEHIAPEETEDMRGGEEQSARDGVQETSPADGERASAPMEPAEPRPVVEAFVPTDSYPRQTRHKQKPKKKKGKGLWILWIALGVLLRLGGLYAYKGL